MQVKVKLFATFRKGRFKEAVFEYPEGTRVRDVIEELKIPLKELGIVFINGKDASLDAELKEGDVLSIFPLVGGG
ncbi:Molybdopterin converting factor, small subunit [Thermosyntropha lipolytica DSM 11003]|uniref:Molybdopterin converting factor, small subunit n=1 Tax=Thermosyntropha lipolytica DSM 11003 TaxID=1123382 RepID=A0A1M5MNJ5_9FIRM|nr:MoaD/ThiS family protein [Thermosyntropha lipolytica]SHG78841.1 Molybdopterin converting factor, small subunit [Thermosyntropha lipolytica DSM 11003]